VARAGSTVRGLSAKTTVASAGKYLFILLVVVITLYPFSWILMSSFKSNREIFEKPAALPERPSFDGYRLAFKISPLARYYVNSIIITSLTTVITISLTTMSAYALARFRFKGRNAIALVFSSALLIPTFSLAYPIYMVVKNLGLIDTKAGLIFVYSAFGLPVRLFILRSYFLTIPRDLEESAYLDGAGIFRTFMKIMVPLARPGIATAATITFIDTWKEFFFALLLTTSDRARTLPLSLNYFVHFFSFDYRAMFAALVVVTLPTILVFIAMQEQVISSLTQGALKG
jgi:raffinose/stachyose/melibiose transport system permease protein